MLPRSFTPTCISVLTLLFAASPSMLRAVSTAEASTVKPGQAIDMASVKNIFKKHSRVAVAGFQVSFVTHEKATAHAANLLGGGSGAKASMETFLGNVDETLMKQIADESYAKFVQQLQESGVEVVPWETVKAAKAYAEVERHPQQKGYTVKFQGATYATVPAADFPLWFNNYDGLAGGKGSAKNLKAMMALSRELNAAILQPSLAVGFAYLQTSGGNFSKRASVDAQNGMFIVPAASVFWGYTDGLYYPKFLDGFWAEGATGKWTKAGAANNTALVKGLLGLGIDIGPASSKKAIVLDADPVVFKARTLEVLAGSGEIFKRGIQDVRR
jgi:hypothetical protein